MADMTHIPGLDLGGFFIPGNNGLPDLYVNASDPAGWTQMQIAARTAPQQPSVAAEAAAAVAASETPAWLKALEDVLEKRLGLSSKIKGFALAAVGLLFAVLLITLGAYKLTQD